VAQRAALAALAAQLALLLGACASGSAGPKPAELPVLQQARELRVLWSASVGPAAGFVFSPVLVGDSVVAAARDGTVLRLAAADGKPLWRAELGVPLSAGAGGDLHTVVVATDEGEVIALEAQTGKQRWRARVSSEVLAAPRPAGGLVLVRSADSRIFAFDAEDGKRRWVYQRASASLMVRTPAGLSVLQDSVYAGFSGGKLVALSLDSGAVRWEATVALPKGATELERVTDIVGDPAVVGREVCAAAFQGRVACFDAQSGNPLWARDMSTVTGVSVDARYAYVSDDRGAVHALDRSSGRSLWKQDRLAYRELSLPLPLGEEIVLGDLKGYVHALTRDSGAFAARVATDGSAVRAAPLRLPEGFLVQTQDGGLYVLAL
jgi:outer membrane protein assembly factor BamB